MSKNVLLLNASLGGEKGNSAVILKVLKKLLEDKNLNCIEYSINEELLTKNKTILKEDLKMKLSQMDAMIFFTGTYWDSWSSNAQIFFEEMTEFEGSTLFLGKPVACIVSMHSVGGKGVLSRLQGIFNTLGMLIPPMSGFVYSLANQEAIKTENTFTEDLWSLDDLPFIVNNLNVALEVRPHYQTWPFDKKDPKRKWINDYEL